MSEFHLAVLVYAPLQLASFILLPKWWWRLAAVPGLIAAPGIFSHGGYMGDVFATMWMIYACAYLVVVWGMFGGVKLIRVLLERRRKVVLADDDADR